MSSKKFTEAPGGLILEVDISNKVNNMIKFGLAGVIIIAILCSAGIWFWHNQRAYLTITDARIASALVGAKVQAPGNVEEILVADGETVEAGQVIAKMKVRMSEEQIRQMEQTLELAKKHYTEVLAGTTVTKPVFSGGGTDAAGAQAEFDRAAGNRARMEQLYAIGAVSAVKQEQAQAQYQAAEAALQAAQSSPAASYENVSSPSTPEAIKAAQLQVNQAQTALDMAKKNMDATEITAPVAGTVYYTDLRAGSTVEAGQTLLNIGDASNLWLEVSLTKEQKEKVRLGQFVSYTVNGTALQGTVLDIDDPASKAKPEAAEESSAADITAKVSLPVELPAEIKPGLPAVVKIALN